MCHFASFTRVRKHQKRKEKVADEIDLEMDTRQPRIVGVDAVPQCGNCVPLQLRGRHVVSGLRIEMGVTAEGNPTTKAFIVNTLKVVKTKQPT